MSDCLLDTSALVDFFEGTESGSAVCDIIEEGRGATTPLAVAELSDICARKGKGFGPQLSFLQQHVRFIPLTVAACAQAGPMKVERRKMRPAFGLIDAMLYLVAQENEMALVTKDTDFEGLENVRLMRSG